MNVMRILAAVAMVLALTGGAMADIIIDTVPVGNVGNAADSTGYGSVSYAYNIGKYEVTAGQYTAFLNAVAKTDTYGLYNTTMSSSSYGCKIERWVGSSGSYTYSVASVYANRPVNYVGFGDSMRFANWLSNGQPATGTQTNGTTEDGTYFVNGKTSQADLQTVSRKPGATWAVTSEDEWYKAAYYDPNKGGAGFAGYWMYPTRSDTAPGCDMADPSGNNANYYTGSGAYPIDSGKYTTVGGEFQNSASAYGTFDQGGNVWEWNDAILSSAYRGVRGGSFNYSGSSLQADSRDLYYYPTRELYSVGLRVSQVPEPGSIALLALGVVGMLRRRKSVRG